MKTIKNISILLAIAMASATLFSCSGNIDDGGTGTGDGITGEGPYYISVDKTELEADGTSVVTFTIKDNNGIDLTLTDPGMCYIQSVETGQYMDRLVRTFSAMQNGTYTFRGSYGKTDTENTVTVTAVNRSKYEKYHRNVAIYKLTGTWCGYCPDMTSALHALPEDVSNHVIVIDVHASSTGFKDPYAIGDPDMGSLMLNKFFVRGGYPSLVINLNETCTDRVSSRIAEAVNQQRMYYPATCGLKVSSKVENGALKAEVTLASDKGGTYDIECAVLLDNQIYAEGTEAGGRYSNILRAYSGNFMAFSSGRDVLAGQEVTKSMEISAGVVEELVDQPNNCRLVVYAFRRLDDGSTMVDNIVSCPVNGSIDYQYNIDSETGENE